MRLIVLRCAFALVAAAFAATGAGATPASYLVFNLETGRVVDQKDAFRPWYPASVTKLMTAYVTFRAVRAGTIGLQSPVVVSANALAEPPSKMGFPVGTNLTIDTALKMVIVKSANDIAVALGEAVSGTEEAFLEAMNFEAKRLGMLRTRFNNPHGLPDNEQVTTARDIALLSRTLMLEFPEFSHYFKVASLRHGKRRLKSANSLLERYPGASGLKTGYICNSGFNMVASARRGDQTIVAVVFGAASGMDRAVHAAGLLDRGFASSEILGPGPKVSEMVAPVDPGVVPEDGYCRRTPRPTAEALLLQHGSQIQSSAAYASLSRSTQEILQQALDPEAKPAKSKKVTADTVLDLLVGQRVIQDPVPVSLGAPILSVVTGKIPTPSGKPAVLAAADPLASTSVTVATASVLGEGGAEPASEPHSVDVPGSAGPVLQAKQEAAIAKWPKKVGNFYLPQPKPPR